MTHRWSVAGGLVAAVVAMSATGCTSKDADEDVPTVLPSPLSVGTAPMQRARIACGHVKSVQAMVKADSSGQLVFAYLDAAVAEISVAAQTEPIWISLQSGIESIRRGLREDKQADSELGIAIARDQCRRAGVFLLGAVRPEPPPAPAGSPSVTAGPGSTGP
jgi:hypothetical protein